MNEQKTVSLYCLFIRGGNDGEGGQHDPRLLQRHRGGDERVVRHLRQQEQQLGHIFLLFYIFIFTANQAYFPCINGSKEKKFSFHISTLKLSKTLCKMRYMFSY
jgi:hypothetical protein